jgi:hypothetical protein
MHAKSCLAERLSTFGIGSVFLLLGAVLGAFSLITLPFFGLIVAAPLVIWSLFLIVAARRAECPLT